MIKVVFLLNIFLTFLFSQVTLNAPSNAVQNEVYIFSLEAFGNQIRFPKIEKVDKYHVNKLGTSSSSTYVNGKLTRSIKNTYSLYPKEDFILPSFEVEVDSSIFKTNYKNIKINKPSKTKSSLIDFSIKVDKNELYYGENFILTLIIKYKINSNIVDLSLGNTNFEGFDYKQLNTNRKYTQGDYEVQEVDFLMSALKTGRFNINPLVLNARVLNSNNNSFFSNGYKNLKIYSNELALKVNELPLGINILGDFKIKASVNKKFLKNNEALSYKITIQGWGNIEDIADIKLDLANQTIYDNKPKIKTFYKDGKVYGEYEKVFSIISNEDFLIKSFEFKYFNKEKQKIEVLKTEEFNIKVEKVKQNTNLEKQEIKTEQIVKIVEKSSLKDRVIFFVLGFLVALLILSLIYYVIKIKKDKEFNSRYIVKKIKSCKTKVELIKILFAYIGFDKQLDLLIYRLETYEDFNIIKKELISLLKKDKYKEL